MNQRVVTLGDVIAVRFPQHIPQAHEQEGYRPAIVVGLPEQLGSLRFPCIVVVPLTTDRGQAWVVQNPTLYLRLPPGIAGLSSPSIVLIDQVRAIDPVRVVRYLGSLPSDRYQLILTAIQTLLRSEAWIQEQAQDPHNPK